MDKWLLLALVLPSIAFGYLLGFIVENQRAIRELDEIRNQIQKLGRK